MALEPSKTSEARPAATDRATGPVPPPPKPVLLIIDDDEAVRASIRVIFKSEFDVLVASSGRAAMELLRTRVVDVATLDLDLPETFGIDVLAQLKQHDPLLEVIIMTGQGSLETARQAIQLGAFAYLTKPFEIQECRRVMRAALERHNRMAGLRALELEMQRRQVEQEIERARSEIYATVIHDLNSPLTTALGLLELLRLDMSMLPGSQPLDVAYVEQQLRDASHQLKFCTDIIKRYLGFMRRAPGMVATSDLGDVLFDLRNLVRVHPAAKQNRLLVHVPDERLVAAINGVDLLQVLLNLTANALQASEQKHHVEVYCRHWTADSATHGLSTGLNDFVLFGERLKSGRPMVSITVQDDGAGIPAEALPQVFRSFHTTKAAGQGTGLGLTVIQRIVEENGGALHVHSVVGEGTAFTVFFPLT